MWQSPKETRPRMVEYKMDENNLLVWKQPSWLRPWSIWLTSCWLAFERWGKVMAHADCYRNTRLGEGWRNRKAQWGQQAKVCVLCKTGNCTSWLFSPKSLHLPIVMKKSTVRVTRIIGLVVTPYISHDWWYLLDGNKDNRIEEWYTR